MEMSNEEKLKVAFKTLKQKSKGDLVRLLIDTGGDLVRAMHEIKKLTTENNELKQKLDVNGK